MNLVKICWQFDMQSTVIFEEFLVSKWELFEGLLASYEISDSKLISSKPGYMPAS